MNLPAQTSADRQRSERNTIPGSGKVFDRSELSRERILVGVQGFSAWATKHQESGDLSIPALDVFNVQAELGNLFCIGLKDLRYYVGVPRSVLSWFEFIPWACVVVDPATHRISFISQPIDYRGIQCKAFTLNFDVEEDGCIHYLQHYHFLDVRSIESDSAGNLLRISQETYFTLSIRIGDTYAMLSKLTSSRAK